MSGSWSVAPHVGVHPPTLHGANLARGAKALFISQLCKFGCLVENHKASTASQRYQCYLYSTTPSVPLLVPIALGRPAGNHGLCGAGSARSRLGQAVVSAAPRPPRNTRSATNSDLPAASGGELALFYCECVTVVPVSLMSPWS